MSKNVSPLELRVGCIFRLIPDTDSSRSRTPFRWEGGQHSVLKPDTIPVIPDTL
jgi:hypothetical protein